MQTWDDMTLVREFAAHQCEAAFETLVARHLNVVYSAAIRQVRDPHLAQEITQHVFILLAQKAGRLSRDTFLTGWLFKTTRYAALAERRAQARRQHWETEAHMQTSPSENPDEIVWPKIAPLLDEGLAHLGETDRRALLLRYFEGQTLAQIGTALALNEEAVRKRVTRSLEKLRKYFAKRGVTLTATVLAGALAANAVKAAPAGLVLTIKAASLATASSGTFTLLKFMTMTHLKLGLATLMVAGVATAFVAQHTAQTKLLGENDALRQSLTQLQTDNATLSNRLTTAASDAPPASEHLELLKLRGEVATLRQQNGELATLRAEKQQLAAARTQESEARTAAAQKQQAINIMKLDSARQLGLALILFSDKNQNQFPTNVAQLASYASDGTDLDQLATNFTLAYIGSLNDLTNRALTIVIAEKQPAQTIYGNWVKAYGFADGHAEIHSEPTANFDDWESQHTMLPPAN